jgi:hypothetical protein
MSVAHRTMFKRMITNIVAKSNSHTYFVRLVDDQSPNNLFRQFNSARQAEDWILDNDVQGDVLTCTVISTDRWPAAFGYIGTTWEKYDRWAGIAKREK